MSDRKTVRLSVNQRGPHWTNFGKIRYWGILLKSVKKIQILLKSGTLHEDRLKFSCCRRHLNCHKHALLTLYVYCLSILLLQPLRIISFTNFNAQIFIH